MANADLVKLAARHRENSYSTQRGRSAIVKMMANQLGDMGFNRLKAKNLKEKHALALIERWREERLTAGTLKNRMAVLRWVYEKVGKSWMLAGRNAAYGIERRQYQTNVNKAREVTVADLERITNPHVRLSVEMQRHFGLRREEAMKIQVAWADRGVNLLLKGSWTKGGRERSIPIRTAEQRDLLERVKQLTGRGSLIPREKSYVNHMRTYTRQVAAAGLEKLHGLRHAYAQERYRELTGWAAPAVGGPSSDELNDEQKALDYEARMTISRELGHGREIISRVYLGK